MTWKECKPVLKLEGGFWPPTMGGGVAEGGRTLPTANRIKSASSQILMGKQ